MILAIVTLYKWFPLIHLDTRIMSQSRAFKILFESIIFNVDNRESRTDAKDYGSIFLTSHISEVREHILIGK